MKCCVSVPVKDAHIISSAPLDDVWEGDRITLLCNITEGTYVLYDWLLNDKQLCNNSSNQLSFSSLSSDDSGKYVCIAKNYFNETDNYNSSSAERNVHVKGKVLAAF